MQQLRGLRARAFAHHAQIEAGGEALAISGKYHRACPFYNAKLLMQLSDHVE
eukprot:CAMPEP_0119316800 /NCGR_PEP_ID=MMETSP1333-20130426/40926_1 /TAXON_ID=418940 /ORGANISM="Scyphosphaera apsteinii, Strain RCC1455" /LENGTH=51 /DNA_ID=CAMNT_0007322545 /DNA_START=1416 /DNA_END=1571 /DNA_ORIENTATION=-